MHPGLEKSACEYGDVFFLQVVEKKIVLGQWHLQQYQNHPVQNRNEHNEQRKRLHAPCVDHFPNRFPHRFSTSFQYVPRIFPGFSQHVPIESSIFFHGKNAYPRNPPRLVLRTSGSVFSKGHIRLWLDIMYNQRQVPASVSELLWGLTIVVPLWSRYFWVIAYFVGLFGHGMAPM